MNNNIKSKGVNSYFFFEVIKKRFPFLFGIIIVVIAIVFSLLLFTGIISNDKWAKIFDPAITIFTLLVASFTTAYTAYIDWLNNLEKRLTVHFKNNNRFICTCYEAYLPNESDIRAWGQTIGAQMFGITFLHFYPFLTQKQDHKPRYDSIDKIYYKLFEVTFHLKDMENWENWKSPKGADKPNNNLLEKYLVWWENNDKSHGNKAVYFNEQPLSPKSIDEAIIELEKQTQNKC